MMDKPGSIYIYYISGTGNAKAAANWIADEFTSKGFAAVVQQIDIHVPLVLPGTEEKPLIGFAFPTHGFNAAPIMVRFIAGFPSGLGRNVFLLNTRAGMKMSKLFTPGYSGMALLLPAFILWIKGYKCVGFRPVDLPSNWIPLHPGLKKKVIDSIFTRCEPIVRRFANKMIEGKKEYRGLYSLPLDLLSAPIAFLYYVGGRFFLSKTFIASYKCTNCGLCIKECPTGSIRLVNNRPYWKLTCESCMRCLNNCPEKAIESAHGMAVLFWLIFSSANALILLTIINITGIDADNIWWKTCSGLAEIAGMIFITSLLYRILHSVMGFKPIKYIVRFTSLTALPFWRRYKKNSRTAH